MKGCLLTLGTLFAGLAGLAVLAIAFVWLNFYDVNVRYRLTVEVKDGDQIRTGSSVMEVEYPIFPDRFYVIGGSANNNFRRVIGSAVTVDLGAKGLLFLTFVDAQRSSQQIIELNKRVFCVFPAIACLPFYAYATPESLPVGTMPSQQKAALEHLLRQSGPRDVPFIALPALARFPDNNHPWFKPISPDQLSKSFGSTLELNGVAFDDLAASFGAGVELKRVVLELTDDSITPPPAIWPEWLKEKCGEYSGTLC